MQTRVLQLKLHTVNRGKAQRLAVMQQAFTDAVRLHLDTAYALPKPSVTSLHAACYHAARALFPLPASIIQQARDKALAIYRGIQTRKRQGKQTSRARVQRRLPRRITVENLRVFPDTGMVRVTTPDGFLWLPVIIPAVWRTAVLCRMPSLSLSAVVVTGISCWP